MNVWLHDFVCLLLAFLFPFFFRLLFLFRLEISRKSKGIGNITEERSNFPVRGKSISPKRSTSGQEDKFRLSIGFVKGKIRLLLHLMYGQR